MTKELNIMKLRDSIIFRISLLSLIILGVGCNPGFRVPGNTLASGIDTSQGDGNLAGGPSSGPSPVPPSPNTPSVPITPVTPIAPSSPISATQIWGSEQQLTFGPEVWYNATAASGNFLHAAFGDGSVNYFRSTDEGKTWSSPVYIGSGTLYLDNPLFADGTNLYIIYVRNARTLTDFAGPRAVGDIFIRASHDNGQTFDPEQQLTSAQGAFRISISASGSQVHVAWMDYRSNATWHIYYRRSTDGGRSFEAERILANGTNSVGAERPEISAAGTTVHLAWMDARNNKPACKIGSGAPIPVCTDVYYKRSLDGGATWSEDLMISRGTIYGGRPSLASSGLNAAVAYDDGYDDLGNVKQFLTQSKDNGKTWTAPVQLSSSPGPNTHSSIIFSGMSINVAWFNEVPQSSKIYFRSSPNNGLTWSSEDVISMSSGSADTPMVSVTNANLHAVWGDNRTGLRQMWHRSRPVQ